MSARSAIIVFVLVLLLCVGTGAALPHAGDSQQVIIVMKEQPASGAGSAQLASFAAESQRDVVTSLKSMGAGEVRPLWSVNAIAATLTDEQVKQVAARRDVARVVPDRIVTLDIQNEPEKGERGMQFFRPGAENGVDWIDPSHPYPDTIAWGVSWIEAPDVWAHGIDGTGVTVAIVDTGIDPDHPDLAGKIVGWADIVNGGDEPYDDHGHGTHCAGTVAGTGAGGIYTGVAPGADLIGIKVFNQEGTANLSTLLAGFERAVELEADIISFSGGAIYFDYEYDVIVLNTPEGIDIPIEVVNDNDGFDPSFILLWVESGNNDDLEITMRQPDGSIYPGVDCDWYEIPKPQEWGMLKYIGDTALAPGEWTLTIRNPSLDTGNKVWHSGGGDNLDNTLYKRFDLTDQIDSLDSLTFRMSTWYDIEYFYDSGSIEVLDPDYEFWDEIVYFTGTGSAEFISDDLLDYVRYEDDSAYLDLRLRYTTDGSIVYAGWYIDWMEIPEIGFYDDASGDQGWTANPAEGGWSRIEEEYPVYYEWLVCYADNGTSLQSEAANTIVEGGTVFVASAGNSGWYGLRTIGGPAAAEHVIAVGATGSLWDHVAPMQDYIAPYSSRGPVGWGADTIIKPDVVAPGTWIVSTVPGGGYQSEYGTSMACPHVSGIAALMLQANSTLSPAGIKSILQTTSVDLGPEGPDYDYGYGRVSAWAAVNATEPLEPPVYDGPWLHAGFGYEYLKSGEENVITAIAWNGTPRAEEPIRFLVNQGGLEVLNETVLTDASGMAMASFEVDGTGYHGYEVMDLYGNRVSGGITVYHPAQPRELLLFDTPYTWYATLPDATVQLKYTVVDPLTMDPYDGDVRMVVRSRGQDYVTMELTPLNGTIGAEINLTGADFTWAEIYLAPVANLTQERHYGSISVQEWDFINKELRPFVSWADRKGNATLLVKQYTAIESKPVPDDIYELPVFWLYEVDVHALSARYPAETARLLAGDIQKATPEYADLFAEIQNMQEDIRYIPYELKNGIGKVSVPVPDGAYIGVVMYDWDYYPNGNQPHSEYYDFQAIILVDLQSFMHHPSVPSGEPDRKLSIRGEWSGEYSEDALSIVPGTEMNVTCRLVHPETGEPMEGTVYLYTSDQSAVVQTNEDGYGSAIFDVDVRHMDRWWPNGLQVIGLSGEVYTSTIVSPPYEYVALKGDYIGGETGGVFQGEISITTPDGVPIPMPAIFDIQRNDFIESYMGYQWWVPATSIFSSYIEGSGSYAGEQPYGSYSLRYAVKDWFWRGEYSQGNWWEYAIYVGATPLMIENLPPASAEPGPVDVTVRMADDRAGVPVYLAYDTFGPYFHFYDLNVGSIADQYGGVDIQTTGPDGRATLRMHVPENSHLYWEIGGGTEDQVFVTRTGYTIQDTPPEPVAPTANFIGVPTDGTAPLTVRFTDTSTGIPTSWSWDFGDGTQSDDRHPVKVYDTPGVYNVTLTVTNDLGSDAKTEEGYITAHVPSRIRIGDLDIATGMNGTTGISVEQIQGAIAVGVNLTFDQRLADLIEITPNASVADDTFQLNYEIDNTTGMATISMTLTRERDFPDRTGIIDIRFDAGDTVGNAPIAITGAEWSPDTFVYEIFRIHEDGVLTVHLRGDFNRNGRIDIGDVARVAYMAVGLTPADPEADFEGTGTVDGNDAAKIAYFYVGKIDEL